MTQNEFFFHLLVLAVGVEIVDISDKPAQSFQSNNDFNEIWRTLVVDNSYLKQ